MQHSDEPSVLRDDSAKSSEPLRILAVAASEASIRQGLSGMIGGQCCLDFAANVEAALDVLHRRPFDVCLIDDSIGVQRGANLLRTGRGEDGKPLMIVLGDATAERAHREIANGADDFIRKDHFDAYTLERRLRCVIDRHRAAERIGEQASIIDLAHDAILVCDLEDRVLFWNRGAENLYGWTAAEALGRIAGELLCRPPVPEREEADGVLRQTGKWSGEFQQLTREGHEVYVESRWTLVRDARGEPRSKLVTNTDITEKKKLQAQFLRTQRLESIGTLAGGIAHDLNNLLDADPDGGEAAQAAAARNGTPALAGRPCKPAPSGCRDGQATVVICRRYRRATRQNPGRANHRRGENARRAHPAQVDHRARTPRGRCTPLWVIPRNSRRCS